jgi:hypothetical protein
VKDKAVENTLSNRDAERIQDLLDRFPTPVGFEKSKFGLPYVCRIDGQVFVIEAGNSIRKAYDDALSAYNSKIAAQPSSLIHSAAVLKAEILKLVQDDYPDLALKIEDIEVSNV